MSLRWLIVTLFLLVTSCGVINSSPDVLARPILTPKAEYFSLAWLPSGWLVVGYSTLSDRFTPHLARVQADGTRFEELILPQEQNCSRTEYGLPTTLPDGRLGLVKDCYPFPPPRGRGVKDYKIFLVAYGISTGDIQPLVKDSIWPALNSQTLSQMTWNPSLDRGMVASSGGLFSSIAWLTRQGIEYATITIQEGNRRWSLDDFFHEDPGHPSIMLGHADVPAWSPDGRSIAFFASPQAIGVDGFARLDVLWNLYLMDPVEQRPRKVLNDIRHPRVLAWSPESKWLAFIGELPLLRSGMWVFEPASSRLLQVTSMNIEWLAWSPDGKQIIGIYDLDPTTHGETELWLFDVNKLVGQ